MTNPFSDIARLFFPPVCAGCGQTLEGEGNGFMCNYCRWEIPLTRFWEKHQNPVMEKLAGHLPLENASAFYFFVHGSGFRDLIHDFKYAGRWSLAEKMGRWYGSELAQSAAYASADVIVPVPLHFRKRLRRGYNQSEYIARGISAAMGVPVDTHSVVRAVHNTSQTHRRKSERWQNVEGIFSVRHPQVLDDRHILLVDDVLTTGATLVSCGEAILRAVPSARLSVATLAVSKSELETIKRVY